MLIVCTIVLGSHHNHMHRDTKDHGKYEASTMSEPFPERRSLSAHLSSVDTLKQLLLEEETEEETPNNRFTEYRLDGQPPESLRAFVNLLGIESHDDKECDRVIWITEGSFIRQDQYRNLIGAFPGSYRLPIYQINLIGRDHSLAMILIHASTHRETTACLGFLFGLEDNYFKSMHFSRTYGKDDDDFICPLASHQLRQILRNTERMNTFLGMHFTPDQCRALVPNDIIANLEFHRCKFEDGGAAFVDSLTGRREENTGTTLKISTSLPFDFENWILFLNTINENGNKLEHLVLYDLELDRESCCAVASAEVQCLELHDCQFEDRGVALTEAVMAGRGPRALWFRCSLGIYLDTGPLPFETPEDWVSFINALRGNNCLLERLLLSEVPVEDHILRALGRALLDNEGLVQLVLRDVKISNRSWRDLFRAISVHPSLRTLDFAPYILGPESDYRYGLSDSDSDSDIEDGFWESSDEARRFRTNTVADMLLVNEQVEEIMHNQGTYDENEWDKNVSPRLECNLYRKRFLAIQKILDISTRAAIFGEAMNQVCTKPSLVWMLLSQNHDIIASCLSSAP
jgi:hypothetical protein